MGYPMAQNLRRGMGEGDGLVVFDVNEAATGRFVAESGRGRVEVGGSVVDVVGKSVSFFSL